MKQPSQVEVAGHDPEASIPQTTITQTQTTLRQTTILQTTIPQATIPQTTIHRTLYRYFHSSSPFPATGSGRSGSALEPVFRLCRLRAAEDEPRPRDLDVTGQHQHTGHHVAGHQEDEQRAHLVVEQQGRKDPGKNAADHDHEGAEHSQTGGLQREDDCLLHRHSAHHLVPDTRYGVDPVIDTQADTKRDGRYGVDRQADTAYSHVYKGPKVGQNAREQEQQPRHKRAERNHTEDEDHSEDEGDIEKIEFI